MTVKTYSVEDVVLTFGGYVLTNWDSISIRQLHPDFKIVSGIRGKNTRIRTLNTAAEIVLTIPSLSDANTVMGEISELDRIYGTGRIVLTIKDISGMEVFSTEDAFITQVPERVYGIEVPVRTWVLNCMSSKTTQSDSAGIESIFDLIF